jgi:hypothetical protein
MELMGEVFQPGPTPVAGACPSCGAGLHAVSGCTAEQWLCASCHACWRRSAHGQLRAVDVIACSGCADQAKEVCLTLLGARFPRFGTTVE